MASEPQSTVRLDGLPQTLYLVRAQLAEGASPAEFAQWYDGHHVPALQRAPGFHGATRFAEIGADNRYLAAYSIDGPEVFETPEYADATGWGPWQRHIVHHEAAVYGLQQLRGPRR
jgi:hypothetical protein